MFDLIIKFSLQNKFLVLFGVLALVIAGVYSLTQISIDAVPDITNNQVQIVSSAPTLAPQEVEKLITYPIESAMTNIPGVTEVRSISRYGMSVITIVFEEKVENMLARQFVQEQLDIAKSSLPDYMDEPELMPITTGLGEIYQYVLTVDKEYAHLYDPIELRTIQDWIIKRQLNGTVGIIEVSSFGGFLKQFEVALDPHLLKSFDLTIPEVIESLERSNQNSGGSYIEKGPNSFYIRTIGRVEDVKGIEAILVKNLNGVPVKVGDLGNVRIGNAKRYGAMTMDGKGEVVGGITLMLKGANSSEALINVQKRIEKIKESLPEGVSIYPYLDRSKLISSTINTVKTNLIEGGLIVIFVLLLMLGNLRAGLIVASVIPLSMLFALILMNYFGISANLMSLGAIDFGIVIDGAVIIVESLLHTLTLGYLGKHLTQKQMDEIVQVSASKIYRAAAFGVLIILVVFIPILTLQGIEGKTFRPMAQTVGFAILGSMLLSLTYVPIMATMFLNKKIGFRKNFSDRIMYFLKRLYQPSLDFSMRQPLVTVVLAFVIFLFSLILFNRLGAEFVPTLEEGDIAMQQSIKPGSSLQESIHSTSMAEQILLKNYPEVEHVVSKIGTAEVPTDPMAIEDADIMIILKDKKEWTSAKTREELMTKMKASLEPITWASYEFTQPIQLRFNELMTGAKSDISIKLFGEDVGLLKIKADEVAGIIKTIGGAGDVKVDQTDGLQQLSIVYNQEKMAQYGVHINEANQIIRAAYAGEKVGNIYEEERKFDLVVRIAPEHRMELDLNQLTVNDRNGRSIPIAQIAEIQNTEGPMLISREQARRFINIGVNVRDRDVASLVAEIQNTLADRFELPPGYEIQYGGQFENLENARNRLLIAVPVALALILFFLYLAFQSFEEVFIIFMAVPLSAIGGVLALWMRGMPFSISSGIGFIALFGVSVLNGIVLLSAIKQLNYKEFPSIKTLVGAACLSRLRPVLMTALVAAFGFLPMAISMGNGAEVQRPLATVVIGGLITSTFLTLLVLPNLYILLFKKKWSRSVMAVLMLSLFSIGVDAQSFDSYEQIYTHAKANNPIYTNYDLTIQQTRLNKNMTNPWSRANLSYQGGQINGKEFDHLLSINQDISPLFRSKFKSSQDKLIDREEALLDSERAIYYNAYNQELSLVYNDWIYWYSKGILYDSILNLYQTMEPKVENQFALGAIDPLEYNLFLNEQNKLDQELANIEYQQLNREGVLRSMAYIPDQIVLIPILITQLIDSSRIAINKNELANLQWYSKKTQVVEQEVEVQKLRSKQVDWDVGAFAQSLNNDYLFNGLSIGVCIPIDKRSYKTRIEQLTLEQQKLTNEYESKAETIEREITAARTQLEHLFTSIQNYQNKVLVDQREILNKAQTQYELGQIDFLRFNKIQERLLESQDTYLDWISAYNRQIIRVNYLTHTKNQD